MKPADLIALFRSNDRIRDLTEQLGNGSAKNIELRGLCGSSKSLLFAACLENPGQHQLCVMQDKEEAAYFYNDLINLQTGRNILFLPSSFKRSVQFSHLSNENKVLRASVLESLEAPETGCIIITYPEAIAEKVISRNALSENTFKVRRGEKLSVSFLTDFLTEYGFRETDFIYEPGQFSIRGSIVDVFSYSDKAPYRIDFFGEEIDTIRTFDIESQLSIEKKEEVTILPDFQNPEARLLQKSIQWIHLIEYISKDLVIWVAGKSFILDRIDQIYKDTSLELLYENDHLRFESKSDFLVDREEIAEAFSPVRIIEMNPSGSTNPDCVIIFNTALQPVFHKNFELLIGDLEQKHENAFRVYILSDNPNQLERLNSVFTDLKAKVEYTGIPLALHEGFIDNDLKVCFYTDHQIFDRYHRFRLEEHFTRKDSLSLRDLTGLYPGDYVVHIDHGIGQFAGLETIDIHGRKQEAVKLVYKDNDILFVSIHSLHRISKYKGKDSQPPKIYKLGTSAWQKLKLTAKKRVKDIARELISLYAKRKAQEGFRFSPDTYLQQELESSFIYEDTVDQVTATRDTKAGMEAPFPMDRLICGDVGFGKTEVAVRAAFKAVADSKQVAVLVPTTILALQHFRTFSDRLEGFPCNIDYLSRLKKPKDQKKTIEQLATGQVDIIIGTHRLVSTDIKFRDLGLLIIDEEQKFGVSVKEKLRKLKINVDTLTLTATPIPRTLQLSLMGARDLSIINTPPPNRYPIVTEVHTFNEAIIREAIEYEVSRSGQVFFIHNRVENIQEVKRLVDQLCPDTRSVVAHGQMEGTILEKIMLDFIDGYYDVLIATTIIESGLDIPNANTMIINNAHHFGLSDLHQLRGRVGRSNKKAFCYLIAPPLTLLTPEAKRRLKAIEEFSELGSGLNIAMHDLDIRGAGNLLGAEQSGFIAEIGFETYHRILDEALQELKEDEYKELFRDEPDSTVTAPKTTFIKDCHIDTDLELLFPEEYISNISERLRLYRILDEVRTEEELGSFALDLNDRFGPVPPQSIQLLDVVRLRWLAVSLGFEKIILKKKRMILYFVSNQESAYYRSEVFHQIILLIQKQTGRFFLKEQAGKLTLSVEGIASMSEAIGVLKMFTINGNNQLQENWK